jgi:hypothetical protein
MADPQSTHADIFHRFLRGEIDARSAVNQLKQLSPMPPHEYLAYPAGGDFNQDHVQEKLAELHAAWQVVDGPEPAA